MDNKHLLSSPLLINTTIINIFFIVCKYININIFTLLIDPTFFFP